MPTFAREIAMEPGDEQRLAVRPAHREYVAELFAHGSIRISGPLADDSGALLIYEAPDLAAAQELVNADPYVQHGVVREVALREWNIIFPPAAT